MTKLTDGEVARMRELAVAGRCATELAAQFGVSRRHVARILRGERRQLLGGLDRDLAEGSVAPSHRPFHRRTRRPAAGCRRPSSRRGRLALAAKLDQAPASDTAAAAGAAPAIARELIGVVATLRGEHASPDRLDELRRRLEARLLALPTSRRIPRTNGR